MDVSLLIRERLSELGLVQRDLAAATEVTESYISQLLTRRKPPPAPERTDIYEKISEFLRLPRGKLQKLAEVQRQHELKKRIAGPPGPLFQDCRELLLRKCAPDSRAEVERILEKEPFGELERLVTRTVLEVVQGVASEQLRSEEWLRSMAQLTGRSYEQARVAILEFLDTDIFQVSVEGCVSLLDPTIDSWDINLRTFAMEVVLNSRLSPGGIKRFEFMEKPNEQSETVEEGFDEFLKDKSLSGDTSDEEIEFLKALKFKRRRPSSLYYYRELQNLRDPLHFSDSPQPTESD